MMEEAEPRLLSSSSSTSGKATGDSEHGCTFSACWEPLNQKSKQTQHSRSLRWTASLSNRPHLAPWQVHYYAEHPDEFQRRPLAGHGSLCSATCVKASPPSTSKTVFCITAMSDACVGHLSRHCFLRRHLHRCSVRPPVSPDDILASSISWTSTCLSLMRAWAIAMT